MKRYALLLHPYSVIIRDATKQDGCPIQCIMCYMLFLNKDIHFGIYKGLPVILEY